MKANEVGTQKMYFCVTGSENVRLRPEKIDTERQSIRWHEKNPRRESWLVLVRRLTDRHIHEWEKETNETIPR